jgi:hypothetical protein
VQRDDVQLLVNREKALHRVQACVYTPLHSVLRCSHLGSQLGVQLRSQRGCKLSKFDVLCDYAVLHQACDWEYAYPNSAAARAHKVLFKNRENSRVACFVASQFA